MKRRLLSILAFSLLAQMPAVAQSDAQPARQTPTSPAASPTDVASVEAILAAVYDVISGPAGQKRNWDRFRSLFIPEARLIPVVPRQDGGFAPQALTVEAFITRSSPFMEKNGFYEKEVARRVERFGHIAHVFSTYESRNKADDPKPFQRGINSIQLANDGKRWWVVTIFWEGERPDNPIPREYLK